MVVLDHARQLAPHSAGPRTRSPTSFRRERRARRCLEGVGVHQPGGAELLDMAVAVDAAGEDELARGVDLARPGPSPCPTAAMISP
jgi:hypothetical protein